MELCEVDQVVRLRSDDRETECRLCHADVGKAIDAKANHYIQEHTCQILFIGSEGFENGDGIINATVMILGVNHARKLWDERNRDPVTGERPPF
jgi:hypothetical protein